jgi:hypothetical protein
MDVPDGALGYACLLSAATAFVTALSMAYVRISLTHLEWWKAKHTLPSRPAARTPWSSMKSQRQRGCI